MNANILVAIHNSWVYDRHLVEAVRKFLPFEGSVEKRMELAKFCAEIAVDSCVDAST